MKKNRIANLIMMLLIAVMLLSGLWAAWSLRTAEEQALGSRYRIAPIPAEGLGSAEEGGYACTITILCDTVLDHLDSLDAAKVPYQPKDGVILPETAVTVSEGETVFEVLQRVCSAAEIPLEYSWTPLYDSYYVEGINHLYEFDCGKTSGWMYQVNGEFPNYGCSAYAVQPGDVIVWCYTCVGLGADVGASMEE